MQKCVFDMDTKCAALKDRKCKDCHFRKTERQFSDDRKAASERINNLPHEQYEYIHEKYHKTK